MIFSVAYLLARRLLGCLMVLARREVSKDAELRLAWRDAFRGTQQSPARLRAQVPVPTASTDQPVRGEFAAGQPAVRPCHGG